MASQNMVHNLEASQRDLHVAVMDRLLAKIDEDPQLSSQPWIEKFKLMYKKACFAQLRDYKAAQECETEIQQLENPDWCPSAPQQVKSEIANSKALPQLPTTIPAMPWTVQPQQDPEPKIHQTSGSFGDPFDGGSNLVSSLEDIAKYLKDNPPIDAIIASDTSASQFAYGREGGYEKLQVVELTSSHKKSSGQAHFQMSDALVSALIPLESGFQDRFDFLASTVNLFISK